MLFKTVLHVLMLSLVFACASGHQSTSKRIRELSLAGDYDGAIKHLTESPLAKEERSKLLYFTELGLLHHYRGSFSDSNAALTSAKELIDELYTTKASGKLKSIVSNDNADFYYGEKYEASLVYFYLALNYYSLALVETDGAKKRDYLRKARSEVVAWDSFLREMKEERLGQALFKEDLLAKTFGAFIHETQNTNQDDQIALQLYKDASEVLFKNYNLYPTYNESYEEFRKNFSTFSKLSPKEVEGKYVLATPHNSSLKQFLTQKIAYLSKKLKKGPAKDSGSITFLVQDGLIAEKVPKTYEIPMVWGAHESMALSMGAGSKVTFELPTVSRGESLEASSLEALDASGNVVAQVPLTVIAPLNELAEQAINEHSTAVATKTATRVISKHVAALAASAATYESGRRNNNSMVMLLAMAGHAASVAAINESEKADVRFWSTLPSNIRMGQMTLKKGSYSFRAILGTPTAPSKITDLGQFEVGREETMLVINRPKLEYKKSEVNRGLSTVSP